MSSRLRFFLPLGSLWAFISIFYFSYRNGYIADLQAVIASRVLPDGEHLKPDMTGISFLDEILISFIAFFYPVVDGRTPNLCLHSVNFAGALGAMWMLVSLESMRAGNKGRFVAFSSFFGMMCQICTFGLVMPLYVTLYLFTSPAAYKPTYENANMPLLQIKALPWSILGGYILPTVLMAFPGNSGNILPSKQQEIAIWQPWPIYVSLLQYGISRLSPLFPFSDSPSIGFRSQQKSKARSGLRYIYAFAFSCAAIPHVTSWSISLTVSAFPTLFNAEIAPVLTPGNVFENTFPWSSARPESLGVGTLWFLQWDHLIGAGVTLLWTISLYSTAHSIRGIPINHFTLALKVISLSVVAGIAGAAVELMWERDELLFSLEDARNDGAIKSK